MGSVKDGISRVGGADFRWSVHRLPTWTSGRSSPGHELLGLAIPVEPWHASRRPLILEFGIEPTRDGDMPHDRRFIGPDARLTEAVQSAVPRGGIPTLVVSLLDMKPSHCNLVNVASPDHPAPGKAWIAPQLAIEHHYPGLPEPSRLT